MSVRPATGAGAAVALAAVALAPAAAPAAAVAPTVAQLVAFKDGSARQKRVAARAVTAKVGSRRCAVGSATPLAALVRSGVGPLRLRDYGSCSKRAADAGGLFVASIAGERNRGQSGWVYKVGNKLATAGAGDPSGPFGRGRLRRGARVTWFYCRLNTRTQSCQRTLALTAAPQGGGAVKVTVRSYDDHARSKPAAGATVHAGSTTATTAADGTATLQLPAGPASVWASATGAVRSFQETVEVR